MQDISQTTAHDAIPKQRRYKLLLVGLCGFTLPILHPELLIGPPLFVTVIAAALGIMLMKQR
jgi:hypothetical protein